MRFRTYRCRQRSAPVSSSVFPRAMPRMGSAAARPVSLASSAPASRNRQPLAGSQPVASVRRRRHQRRARRTACDLDRDRSGLRLDGSTHDEHRLLDGRRARRLRRRTPAVDRRRIRRGVRQAARPDRERRARDHERRAALGDIGRDRHGVLRNQSGRAKLTLRTTEARPGPERRSRQWQE